MTANRPNPIRGVKISRSLSLIVVGVYLCKARPLLRQIVEGEDRRDGAHRDTRATIDALYWVNVDDFSLGKIGFVFPWVDTVHWTCVYTRRVLNANARLCDYLCHLAPSQFWSIRQVGSGLL